MAALSGGRSRVPDSPPLSPAAPHRLSSSFSCCGNPQTLSHLPLLRPSTDSQNLRLRSPTAHRAPDPRSLIWHRRSWHFLASWHRGIVRSLFLERWEKRKENTVNTHRRSLHFLASWLRVKGNKFMYHASLFWNASVFWNVIFCIDMQYSTYELYHTSIFWDASVFQDDSCISYQCTPPFLEGTCINYSRHSTSSSKKVEK